MEAEIILYYKSRRTAKAVAKSVSPDNVKVPPGLTIKTTGKGSKVITQVKCEGRFETLIATLDDLLMAVQVAERTVSACQTPYNFCKGDPCVSSSSPPAS